MYQMAGDKVVIFWHDVWATPNRHEPCVKAIDPDLLTLAYLTEQPECLLTSMTRHHRMEQPICV